MNIMILIKYSEKTKSKIISDLAKNPFPIFPFSEASKIKIIKINLDWLIKFMFIPYKIIFSSSQF